MRFGFVARALWLARGPARAAAHRHRQHHRDDGGAARAGPLSRPAPRRRAALGQDRPRLPAASCRPNEARAAAPLPGAGAGRLDLRPRGDARCRAGGPRRARPAAHAAAAHARRARPPSAAALGAASAQARRSAPARGQSLIGELADASCRPPARVTRSAAAAGPAVHDRAGLPAERSGANLAPLAPPAPFGRACPAAPRAPPGARAAGRWSASAWLLVRDDGGGPALAPGGTLGGSQAGARLLYRMGGGLALSGARLSAAAADRGRRGGGRARLAARRARCPSTSSPNGGRRWAATAAPPSRSPLYGGAQPRPAARPAARRLRPGRAWSASRSRDLFVDGSVRVSRAARPGRGRRRRLGRGPARRRAARRRAQPSPGGCRSRGANSGSQADWRFRVAGDAAPGSGPALTLAADF